MFGTRVTRRRDDIDKPVQEMAAAVRRVRPGTRFGGGPFGVWRNAATDPRGSDTRAGVRTYDPRGHPQMGPRALDRLPRPSGVLEHPLRRRRRLREAGRLVGGRRPGTATGLYSGEALYKAGAAGQPTAWQDPAELSRHLTLAARHPQVRGHMLFAAGDVARDPVGAMERVMVDHYRRPAKPPL